MKSYLRNVSAALLVFAVGLFTVMALAAPPKKGDPKPRQFDFETDEVTIDVLKPDAMMVEVLRQKARRTHQDGS